VMSGAEKQAWTQCKVALQVFNPSWKQEGGKLWWMVHLDQLQARSCQGTS
jgi:hypothetical protein